MGLTSIDHVQLAMPAGREPEAVAFYEGVLGLAQQEKPPHLACGAAAGSVTGAVRIHLGVEADFRPARKAHPALLVEDLDDLVGGSRPPATRCARRAASTGSASATSTTRSATASSCSSRSAPNPPRGW